MPKKQFQHTAHLSSEVEAILQERSRHFPSVNAYFEHAIRTEKAASNDCKTCVDRKVSAHTRELLAALGLKIRK